MGVYQTAPVALRQFYKSLELISCKPSRAIILPTSTEPSGSYTDNTIGSVAYDAGLDGWKQHDILAQLAPGKSLKSLRVYAYSNAVGPSDQVFFDDFHLCRKP